MQFTPIRADLEINYSISVNKNPQLKNFFQSFQIFLLVILLIVVVKVKNLNKYFLIQICGLPFSGAFHNKNRALILQKGAIGIVVDNRGI